MRGEYIDVAEEDCYNMPMNSVPLSGGAEMGGGERLCKGQVGEVVRCSVRECDPQGTSFSHDLTNAFQFPSVPSPVEANAWDSLNFEADAAPPPINDTRAITSSI